MAVTFKNYVSVLLRQAWRDTKSFFGWNFQTVTAAVLVVLSWVVLGQWKGQAAVQGELVPMLAFLAPLLIAALLIFGVNTLVITPYRLINREISKKKAAIAQCNALRENQKPALKVEVRDGDNRYLITADHSQGNKRLGTAYAGRFSVSNPPDHTESVHGVTVVLKDILGTGTDFRDVRLRFDGESQAYPIPINPGEMRFVEFVRYVDAPGHNDVLRVLHTGTAGRNGVSTAIPRADRYVAMIHITGTNMPLISKLITFGVDSGRFHFSMRD